MIYENVANLGLASAVAIFLIVYLTKLVTSFKRTIDNHLDHSTQVLAAMTGAIQELTAAVRENTEMVRKLE